MITQLYLLKYDYLGNKKFSRLDAPISGSRKVFSI